MAEPSIRRVRISASAAAHYVQLKVPAMTKSSIEGVEERASMCGCGSHSVVASVRVRLAVLEFSES